MGQIFSGIFILLHGLVHVWYFLLSAKIVPFKPEMGWNGTSWVFTPVLGSNFTIWASSFLYLFVTILFAAGGIGLLFNTLWSKPVILWTAIISSFVIIFFWDGNTQQLVQKGLIGLFINLAIIGYLKL
jgi:hypothetical protein